MQFLNPIWLWALAGLLIPIGIHLFSRREGKVIPMGSLRFLRESPTARYKNFALNEILLLVLRCLLITLLVLLLAGAKVSWSPAQPQKWLVVEPGIENSDEIKSLIKNVETKGFQLRSLARGFPLAPQQENAQPFDNYWSAARQLISFDLDSIVVVSYNYLRNFKGERIAMPAHMKWIPYPAEGKEFIAQTVSLATDSVWIRKGTTSPSLTHFETVSASSSHGDSSGIVRPKVLEITIFAADDFSYDVNVLLACLRAIPSITPHKLNITTKKTEKANGSQDGINFWLARQPPPPTQDNITIAYLPCDSENLPLLISSGKPVAGCMPPETVPWLITRRLNEDIVLREHLTLQLAKLILPSPVDEVPDQRVLPEMMMWSSVKNDYEKTVVKGQGGNTDLFITILFVLLLLGERVVAYNRNQ